jgi:hypothetical protein
MILFFFFERFHNFWTDYHDDWIFVRIVDYWQLFRPFIALSRLVLIEPFKVIAGSAIFTFSQR